MDIDSIQLVIEVVRQASFAGAARQRDVDPSSVSRMIAAVEEELGFRIFQRTTRSMSLTEAGERYVRRAELALQELDAAAEEATALGTVPRGRLRLTASVAFGNRCLVPLLPKFRTEFPELQLELILTDSNLDLVSDGIDLAIRLGPGVSGDLVGAKLFDTRYRVCASPAYLRGISRPKRPADLSGMPCLLFTFPGFRSRWLFRNQRGDISEVAVHGDLLLSNALGLRDCARAGLGPALLPDWLIDEDLAGKRLVDLFPDWQVTATTFDTAAYVLYPNRAFLPVKVRRTIDFLRRHLAKQVKRARR